MNKSIVLILSLFFVCNICFAQENEPQKPKKEFKSKAGLKVGYNINKLAGTSADIKFDNKSGFMVGGFFSPSSKGILGFRTELVFSRQGFSYDDNDTKQEVQTDYIYLPQLTTISISKFFQLQVGGQMGYLLKSSAETQNSSEEKEDVTEHFNRLDYGAAFGFELYPVKGFILGSRYNMSFGSIYEQKPPTGIPSPFPFTPEDVKGRNAVLQFFVGYRF
ncbi:MAG: PorT family protein [Bacteroidota bacterium]|nr:PorT family protein [Bacteroidota bacterium]